MRLFPTTAVDYPREGMLMTWEKKDLEKLICTTCDFYKESDEDLECGAYKILKALLEKGTITAEEIRDVIAP